MSAGGLAADDLRREVLRRLAEASDRVGPEQEISTTASLRSAGRSGLKLSPASSISVKSRSALISVLNLSSPTIGASNRRTRMIMSFSTLRV